MSLHRPSEVINIDLWIELAMVAVYDRCLASDDESHWSDDDARQWVRCYFDDMLNEHLYWTQTTYQADDFLEQWCERTKLSDYHTILHALKPVTKLIQEAIAHYTGDYEWWIWIPQYRGDCIIMESEGDYRIHVFHEKVNAGEWSVK